MDFAARFAELRADNDIKQKDLAKLLNVSVSAVSHYEKGLNTPDLDSLILLADYFNVSLDYLAGRSAHRLSPADDPMNQSIPLPSESITFGSVLEKLLALSPEQRGDIIRHLNALNGIDK